MGIAIGSTMETQNSLKDGIDRGYFTVESIDRASELAQRCIQVSTKLLLYLERFPDVRSVRLQADRREVRLKPDTTYYTEPKTVLKRCHKTERERRT